MDILTEIEKSMLDAKLRKEQADAQSEARQWAVVYTDLEHVYAFVQYILKENEK